MVDIVPAETAIPSRIQFAQDRALEVKTTRKIILRIVPFLMLCYLISYVDRVNIGFAALQMNHDLALTGSQFGLASSIFFIGYVIFEIPSNLLLEKFGARLWIARIMITWGIIGLFMAAVAGIYSLYVVRFLLGVAEAGFLPGVILYVSYWLPAEHRARVVSIFMVAIPLSSIVGSPISAALLNLDGVLGLRGWQWLFIMESVPAIIAGFLCLKLLADRPGDVAWLNPEERNWLFSRLDEERKLKHQVEHVPLWRLLGNKYVLVLGLAVGAGVATSTTLSIWQPQVIKSFGQSTSAVGWLNPLPFVLACAAMIMWGRRSDTKRERVFHTIAPLFVAAAAFASAIFVTSILPTMIILCFALSATYALKGPVWALSTEWLSPTTAAAGIAAINALGNLWGALIVYFFGVVKDATGSYREALLLLAALNAFALISLAIMTSSRRGHWGFGRVTGSRSSLRVR